MKQHALSVDLQHWVIREAQSGADPEAVLAPLLAAGWDEQAAIDAVQEAVARHVAEAAARENLPLPVAVPVPIEPNGASVLDLGDRLVHVLASFKLPRVVLLGGFLADEECDELVAMSAQKLRRSTTVDPGTGADQIHADRTSTGTWFERGGNALCLRIEARIARLLDWPLENGEGIQILRYGPGAQYKPHHDYFDPGEPSAEVLLRRGGQRVATVVMYLNTPQQGGATVFPDVHLEVAAVKGNALFFSYDRPHSMTRTLHGGAAVKAGEKWIATKWLREQAHA